MTNMEINLTDIESETETFEGNGEARLIAWADLVPNPWNRGKGDAADLEKLAASIARKGFLQPLLVRVHPTRDDMFEIVAGEQRYHAASLLGRESLPALVRETMTDAEVMEVMEIENHRRVNPTALQQAQVIREYREKGYDTKNLAAALGESAHTIKRREKLLSLSPGWLEVLGSKDADFVGWSVGMYELIAPFDPRTQEALLKDIQDHPCADWSVSDLEDYLAKGLLALKVAPWDLDDATLLPVAGACTGCPNRTDAQADLFGDVETLVKAGARCMDGGCFEAKRSVFLARRQDELGEKHPDLVVVTKEFSGAPGALQPNQWEPAKKSDAGAVPAMDSATGNKLWVLPTGKKQPDGPGRKKKSDADRLAEHEQRRVARAIEKLIEFIQADDLIFDGKHAGEILIGYCLTYGVSVKDPMSLSKAEEMQYAKGEKGFTLDALWTAVAEDMAHTLRRSLHMVDPVPSLDLPSVKLCAWMVDANLKALKKEADAELPLPASLGGRGVPMAKVAGDDADEGVEWEHIEVPEEEA